MKKFAGEFKERFFGNERYEALFRRENGDAITREQVSKIVRETAILMYGPGEKHRFSSHSLRSGGASALYFETESISTEKQWGRWKSDAVYRYLFNEDLSSRATSKMIFNGSKRLRCWIPDEQKI